MAEENNYLSGANLDVGGKGMINKWMKPLPDGSWAQDEAEYDQLLDECADDVRAEAMLGTVLRDLMTEPVGKGSKGEELAAIGAMKRAGAAAISDDGRPVMNARVMRRAMELARSYDIPVINHCEDLNLSAGFFELRLKSVGFVFCNTFLNWLWCSINEVLGFFEAETGDSADFFNNVNLLVARSSLSSSYAYSLPNSMECFQERF